MSDREYDPGTKARLKGFLNRVDIRDSVDRIVSARGRLRELGTIGLESPHWENNGPELEIEFDELLVQVGSAVDELQDPVQRNEVDLPERPSVRPGERGGWSLGIEDIRGPIISFLRGELEPVRRVVVAPSLPDGVVIFFLSVDGLRDLLVREVHGHWGYHYHYLDSKRRRSDTLLTFKHELKTLAEGGHVKVLTWERHAENRHFSARAASWGEKKRESVYQACITDSAKRSLSDFKVPARDAEVIWPV